MTQSHVIKLNPSDPGIDPAIARQVGQEILDNRLDPATWATALSASGGKRQDALAVYARLRMQHLGTRRRRTHQRAESFDCRRIKKCFGVRTVQDLLQKSSHGKQLNFLKPRLSVISLVTLGIGAAGCVGSLGRLLAGMLPQQLSATLPLVAVLFGIAAVISVVSLRFILPKRWIMLGWNSGLLATCALVCLASLLFGVKLIAHAPPLEIRQATLKLPASENRPVLVRPKTLGEPLTASNGNAR